jgi:hypothetical protein
MNSATYMSGYVPMIVEEIDSPCIDPTDPGSVYEPQDEDPVVITIVDEIMGSDAEYGSPELEAGSENGEAPISVVNDARIIGEMMKHEANIRSMIDNPATPKKALKDLRKGLVQAERTRAQLERIGDLKWIFENSKNLDVLSNGYKKPRKQRMLDWAKDARKRLESNRDYKFIDPAIVEKKLIENAKTPLQQAAVICFFAVLHANITSRPMRGFSIYLTNMLRVFSSNPAAAVDRIISVVEEFIPEFLLHEVIDDLGLGTD